MEHPSIRFRPETEPGGEMLLPAPDLEALPDLAEALQRVPVPDPGTQFRRLIPDISCRLINATEREVDREIASVLEQVRGILGLDRFCLLGFSPDKREAVVSHASQGHGVPPLPERIETSLLFSWADRDTPNGAFPPSAPAEPSTTEAAPDRSDLEPPGEANLALPIQVAGSLKYLLLATRLRAPHRIPSGLLPALRLLGELFANALVRCGLGLERQETPAEFERPGENLPSEAKPLSSECPPCRCHEEIVGQSAALARTLAEVEQVAPTDSTVLIHGETGTGKELVAQAIHRLGARRNREMVKVNCASLPAALVESELFGREKGAYTGALTRQAGRFELADGGTIFLDEIAEMSLELQAKLLRVLQEGQFERLGSTRTVQVDVRVIAATNRNLAEEVRKGNFREDLYYRLNVFRIVVPPLRERREDIPVLTWNFVQEFGEKMGKKINRILSRDMAALQGYRWPGNVRELRNVVEHAVIVSSGETLQVRLPEQVPEELPALRTLEEYEIMHIREALRLTGWRIKGEGGAARLLGLNPSTLYSRMQKLGIAPRPARDDISA